MTQATHRHQRLAEVLPDARLNQVHVPYSVIYDLRGDQISALRIYFPMSQLMQQLTS